jgi:nucleoside-diphosphate-sugar epimerase
MTNILVAGGAGYIGSHTCLDLFTKGFTPIVYDNLSNGHAEFVKWGPLAIGDIRDRGKLDEVLGKYKPEAIVHFAAAIEVGESVRDPGGYYDNNVAGTITLLRAAQAAGIDKIVFSSTCATYGIPSSIPMDEAHAQSPINPYGRSKLIVEQILKDLDLYQGFRSVILPISMLPGRTLKEELANGIRRKPTPYRLQSRPLWDAGHIFKFSAPTIILAMDPACATSSTSLISPMHIPVQSSTSLITARAMP